MKFRQNKCSTKIHALTNRENRFHTFDEVHQKIGSHIYPPRNVSLWPANGSSPLILRRLVHVEDSVKAWTQNNINRIYKIFAIIMIIINDILYMWLFSLDVIFTHRHLQTVSLADIEGKRGEHFPVFSIILRYISIKKWLTDFWCLTVVTISILKGRIWGQKYLQQ